MKGSVMLYQTPFQATEDWRSQTLNEAFERLGYHFNKTSQVRLPQNNRVSLKTVISHRPLSE